MNKLLSAIEKKGKTVRQRSQESRLNEHAQHNESNSYESLFLTFNVVTADGLRLIAL